VTHAGVLLFMPQPAVIIAYKHKECAYSVLDSDQAAHLVEPLPMETLVCRVGSKLLIRGKALGKGLLDLDTSLGVRFHQLLDDDLLVCKFRVPDDETLEGLVPIHVLKSPLLALGLNMQACESMEEDVESQLPSCFLNVPISDVVGALADAPEGARLFRAILE
jgi:hypothetical protein